MVNPFPPAGLGHRGRANAHHNPMQPYRNERSGVYRPRVASRVPRAIPDDKFNELFALLPSHRDRALVAFWVSTGARAAELLGASCGDVDPGRQLITVIRKGSRALQPLPASPDAFVLEGPGDPPPWNRFAAPGARCRDRVETPDRQGDSP